MAPYMRCQKLNLINIFRFSFVAVVHVKKALQLTRQWFYEVLEQVFSPAFF